MVHLFNRKMLLSDPSAQEAARVRLLLKQAGIPFSEKTSRVRGIIGRFGDVQVTRQYNMPYERVSVQENPMFYTIYVRRKDFNEAKALCG